MNRTVPVLFFSIGFLSHAFGMNESYKWYMRTVIPTAQLDSKKAITVRVNKTLNSAEYFYSCNVYLSQQPGYSSLSEKERKELATRNADFFTQIQLFDEKDEENEKILRSGSVDVNALMESTYGQTACSFLCGVFGRFASQGRIFYHSLHEHNTQDERVLSKQDHDAILKKFLLLLEYKADVNLADNYAITPLMFALDFESPHKEKMVDALIRAGAKPKQALTYAKKKHDHVDYLGTVYTEGESDLDGAYRYYDPANSPLRNKAKLMAVVQPQCAMIIRAWKKYEAEKKLLPPKLVEFGYPKELAAIIAAYVHAPATQEDVTAIAEIEKAMVEPYTYFSSAASAKDEGKKDDDVVMKSPTFPIIFK